ncbi:MAG: IPT/TIG domain-containing protein [Kineosporiaceae bacterium]
MSTLKNLTTSRTARIGLALGVATAASLGLGSGSANAAVTALKLSRATGPATSTTTVISVTGTGFRSAAGANQVGVVEFQTGSSCATTSGSGTAVTTKSVASATNLVITTPSLAAGSGGAAKAYVLCVFSSAPALIGQATYTVYSAPTVTATSLAKGPTTGGQTVSVDGTNFTKAATVTVGGVAATGVKFVSATSLTFVTPKAAKGATNIKVTTEGGTSATGAGNAYTYLNAVTVSPSTGVVDGGDVITVTGAGFDALDFSAGANHAAVLFVPGVYAKAVHGVGGSAAAAVCGSVQVVSDTQLVCTTPDFGTADTNDAAFTVTVVDDKAYDATSPSASVVSSSATFTAAAF